MGTGLSYLDVREAVAGAAATLFAHGVMSRTGHGDLSARAPEDHLILTIPGRLRGLTPQELAMVSLDGEVVEGGLDSLKMEIAALHARLYRLRHPPPPGVRARVRPRQPPPTVQLRGDAVRAGHRGAGDPVAPPRDAGM